MRIDSENSWMRLIATGAIAAIIGGVALYYMGYGGNEPDETRSEQTSFDGPGTRKPSKLEALGRTTPTLPDQAGQASEPVPELMPATTEIFEKKFSWISIKARGDAIPWAKNLESRINEMWEPWNLDALSEADPELDNPSERLFATSNNAAVIYSAAIGADRQTALSTTTNFSEFFTDLNVTFDRHFPIREIEKTMPGVRLIARGDAIDYGTKIWESLNAQKQFLSKISDGKIPPRKSEYSFSTYSSGIAIVLPHMTIDCPGPGLRNYINFGSVVQSEIERLARGEIEKPYKPQTVPSPSGAQQRDQPKSR